MDVLVFVIILSFLVIIHELGHFFAARRFGMKVEEYGLGYPPKALTLAKDKKGTEYTLNWLPFGGFVRIAGEDGSEGVSKKTGFEFFTKPVWQRVIVVVAGAAVNFLFGVLAFGVIYSFMGIPTQYPYAVIKEVAPGSPAEQAGIKPEDAVVEVVVNGEMREVTSSNDFIEEMQDLGGQTVTLRFKDESQVEVYVRKSEEIPQGQGALGVSISDYELRRYPWYEMPFRGMAYGLKTAVEFGGILLGALGDMAWRFLSQGQVPKDVAGPVGIAYVAQKEGILSAGWLERFNFAAILSINLAIVNVLPIPALDGGRLVFLVWEGLTKRKVKPELERKVNVVGFLALISLLVLISVRDVGTVLNDSNVQNWFKNTF